MVYVCIEEDDDDDDEGSFPSSFLSFPYLSSSYLPTYIPVKRVEEVEVVLG